MNDSSPYNAHLAGHTARVIVALHTLHGTPDGGWPVADVLRAVTEQTRSVPLGVRGNRHVAARQHIACYVAVYASRFHPGAGAELAAPSKRQQQLIWRQPDGSLLLDHLDCGNPTSTLAQEDDRCLREAAQVSSVRVIRLAAPGSSRIWHDTAWCPLTGAEPAIGLSAERQPGSWLPASATRAS